MFDFLSGFTTSEKIMSLAPRQNREKDNNVLRQPNLGLRIEICKITAPYYSIAGESGEEEVQEQKARSVRVS